MRQTNPRGFSPVARLSEISDEFDRDTRHARTTALVMTANTNKKKDGDGLSGSGAKIDRPPNLVNAIRRPRIRHTMMM